MKLNVHWLEQANSRVPAIELKLINDKSDCFATVHAVIDWNWSGTVYVSHQTLGDLRIEPDSTSQSWLEINPLPLPTKHGYVQVPRWRGQIQFANEISTIELYQGLRGMESTAKVGQKFLKQHGIVVVFDPAQNECTLLHRQAEQTAPADSSQPSSQD